MDEPSPEKYEEVDMYKKNRNFAQEIDSYKDKSKRKLIDLSFSNRSEDHPHSNGVDTGLQRSRFNTEEEKMLMDSMFVGGKGHSLDNSNEETPMVKNKFDFRKKNNEKEIKKENGSSKKGVGWLFKKLCCLAVDD